MPSFLSSWSQSRSLVLVLTALAAVHATPHKRSGRSSDISHKQYRSCGQVLLARLRTICKHKYANPFQENMYRINLAEGGDLQWQRRPHLVGSCCKMTCTDAFVRQHFCATPPADEAAADGAVEVIVVKREAPLSPSASDTSPRTRRRRK